MPNAFGQGCKSVPRCKFYNLSTALLKTLVLEHHVATKKPTMMQKEIITFSPTYFAKVTYIKIILKFLNTESLVVQLSNTRFNIQSLHL